MHLTPTLLLAPGGPRDIFHKQLNVLENAGGMDSFFPCPHPVPESVFSIKCPVLSAASVCVDVTQ